MKLSKSESIDEFWWDQVGNLALSHAERPACPARNGRFRALPAILGIPFDPVTLPEAVQRIDEMICLGEPHHVVTANLDYLTQAARDAELRRILLRAHLVVCDGTPLVWASRILGCPLPERVAGSDLVHPVLRLAEQRGYRPFFLGGEPEVSAQAAARVQAQYPGLNLAGSYAPPVRPLLEMNHDEIVRRIRSARPDLLLVSFGCPKAEKWIAMHYRRLRVPVTIGVGATIDFLAGRVRRAPCWMRRAGLEWVFRLVQEPRRLLTRYADDLFFFGRSTPWHWRQLRWRIDPGSPRLDDALVAEGPTWMRLRAPETLGREFVEGHADLWLQIRSRHCLLETEQVKRMDAAGLGLLLWIQRQLHWAHARLVLLNPSNFLHEVLRELRLSDWIATAGDASEAWMMIANRGQAALGSPREFGSSEPWLWEGEITVDNAKENWKRVLRQIRRAARRQCAAVVDLSALAYIDSTGARLLARAKQTAARLGLQLRFVSIPSHVLNVLRFSKLEGVLLDEVG